MRAILKGLAILDTISLLSISLHWIIPQKILFYVLLYLIIKGLFFVLVSNDFASYIDIFCGLYVGLLILGISVSFISVLCVVYLAQKAAFSLLF
jgi:hypothetical protein